MLVAIMIVAVATPQQISKEPAPADPVIRVTVGLVQVDAVVTDGKGNHIADLKPEDFEVFEDGKKQVITHFSYVKSASAPANPTPVKAAKNTPRVENEIALGPTRQLKANEVRRMLVLVADTLGISAENIPRVKATMKNFVDNQMQPGDLVSVTTTDKGMGALQQFTNDKRQLYAAIEKVRWVSYGRAGVNTFETLNEDPVPDDPAEAQMMQDMKDFEQAAENQRSDNFSQGTIGTLNYVIQGVKDLPGRKAIVLFSQGFALYRSPTVDRIPGTGAAKMPDNDDRTQRAAKKLTDAANRAGVVMYAFDIRGLAVTAISAADRVAVNPRNPGHINDLQRDRTNSYQDSQDGLEFLAKETGGLFFRERNDFESGMAKTLDDLSSYYLIGYQPQRPDTGEKGKETYHKIQLKLKRSGLHVRSRSGYLGDPDTAPKPLSQAEARKDQISRALFSPFQTGDVRIKLSPFYSAMGTIDAKGRRDTVLRGVVHIDLRDVTFKDTENGKRRAAVDVVIAVYDSDNKVAGSKDQTFTMDATAKQIENSLGNGLNYQIDLPIGKPGAYQMRTAVRDVNSEKTGSANVFVQIPDYNKPKISLSSVVLYEQADTGKEARKETDALKDTISGAGSPAMRVFAPGVSIGYATYAFNAKSDAATGKPKLEMEVRLYKENKKIFASSPLTVTIPADVSKTGGAIPAMGKIKIPSGMEPGDYSVVVILYDRLTEDKKAQTAVQWIDFTLAKPEGAQPAALLK